MNPSWPSMLMSSTLARDSSSVLRSRPIGLPRYQVNEKCGPRMPPPASHWQPTEVRRGVDQAGDPGLFGHRLVADAAALAERTARARRSACGAGVCGTLGSGRLRIRAGGKHRNHGRGRHGQRLRVAAPSYGRARALGVTPCTVAAALNAQPPTCRLTWPFQRILRCRGRTRTPRSRCATVAGCSGRCCDSMCGRTEGCSPSLRCSS